MARRRDVRGWNAKSDTPFSFVSCQAWVRKDHPLRSNRQIVDEGADCSVAGIRKAVRQT